jgi:hypothetical protein
MREKSVCAGLLWDEVKREEWELLARDDASR